MDTGSEEIGPERKLRRQKVRVRYRERTKLKKRPRGYYIKRFFRKYGVYLVWASLIVISVTGILTWVYITTSQNEKERIEKQERIEQEQRSKRDMMKKKW
jgi:hypothetical protein